VGNKTKSGIHDRASVGVGTGKSKTGTHTYLGAQKRGLSINGAKGSRRTSSACQQGAGRHIMMDADPPGVNAAPFYAPVL
jgi:hypothetical protein